MFLFLRILFLKRGKGGILSMRALEGAKSSTCRRYNEVPNLGLGPKWDQSPNLVPKKSQFCMQVPNFWPWGVTLCCKEELEQNRLLWSMCACLWNNASYRCFGGCWAAGQKWYPKGLNFALNVATTRFLKPFFAFCKFCGIFMKITTKSPRKV